MIGKIRTFIIASRRGRGAQPPYDPHAGFYLKRWSIMVFISAGVLSKRVRGFSQKMWSVSGIFILNKILFFYLKFTVFITSYFSSSCFSSSVPQKYPRSSLRFYQFAHRSSSLFSLISLHPVDDRLVRYFSLFPN